MKPQQNPDDAWTIASAKARLSEVIARAQKGPQTITRNGRPSAMIVSVEEWERKSRRDGSLARFLAESPLAGSELELERSAEAGRDVAL